MMVCMNKYVVVFVAGLAIGLFSTKAAYAQPDSGDRPHGGAVGHPDRNAPADDAEMGRPGPGGPGAPSDADDEDGRPPMPPSGMGHPNDGPGGTPAGMQKPRGGEQGPQGMGLGQGKSGPMGPGMVGGGMPMDGHMFGPHPGNDPDMAKLLKQHWELEQQVRQLASDYRNASSEQRQKIKSKLVVMVNKQFDVRQECRAIALKRMEEDLKRLRESLDQRAKTRKDIVEKRITKILGPEDEEQF
jgi:hypothetical protein